MSEHLNNLIEDPAPLTMKAVRVHGRGGVEQLRYEEAVPLPVVEPGDALVRVVAVAVTPTELTWDPTYQEADGTSRVPSVPGHEVAGVIEAIAPNVTDLQPGEEVWGLVDFYRDGGAAEFVTIAASALAPKPKSIDFIAAAAATLSGLTAWQALFVHAKLAPGQKVLIHGGAGGVGVFAIQLARWCGARVTVTARKKDTAFLAALGADRVIDYENERFEELVSNQDVVLDLIGGETQNWSWQVLRKGGMIINLSGPLPAAKLSQYGMRGVFFIVEPSREQLDELAKLIDEGKLKSIVSRVLPLDQIKQAFLPPAPDHLPGKTVIAILD
jgi:NADPH:quinone reductase-like Zn-dependent oxidoreductase